MGNTEIKYSLTFNKPLVKGLSAYDNFAGLQQKLITLNETDIKISIDWNGRLGRTYLFLINCLGYLALEHGKNLNTFNVSNKIYNYLNNMKFLEVPQLSITPNLRFIRLNQKEDTLDMAKNIVKNIPAELSPKLYEDMVSKIGEMYNNSREHANAKHVLGCRYSKPGKKYCFACYDTGIGISKKVRNYHEKTEKEFSDKKALEWALAPFNSTAERRIGPKGQGLDLLKNFAKTNKGEIRICTGKVLYTYKGETNTEEYRELKNRFWGTLFEMDINAFDGKYSYRGENNNENNY